MDVRAAIEERRSIKRFEPDPPSREQIEQLIAAAVHAPNHRLTSPWRFYVLGPEARYAYGLALGERKARKLPDPEAGRALRDRTAAEHRELPCVIAAAMSLHDDPETREEDYAAVMMGVQNIALAALELGLGTHIKTGAVMNDPAARSAVGVPDNERIVAMINVGTPAEAPPARSRALTPERTTWVP